MNTHRLAPPIRPEHFREQNWSLRSLTIGTETRVSKRASRKDAKPPAVLQSGPAHTALSILRPSIHTMPLRRLHNDTIRLDVILQSSLDNAILALALRASTLEALYPNLELISLIRKSIWKSNHIPVRSQYSYRNCILDEWNITKCFQLLLRNGAHYPSYREAALCMLMTL